MTNREQHECCYSILNPKTYNVGLGDPFNYKVLLNTVGRKQLLKGLPKQTYMNKTFVVLVHLFTK